MSSFFNMQGFMPHGHCYLWKPELIGLHVISDVIIMLCYYSIPFLLVVFILNKKKIPFNWLFIMFALFILACGTTHLMEIINVWEAYYTLSGIIKLITAIVSLATVVCMIRIVPKILTMDNKGLLFMSYNELVEEVDRLRKEKEEWMKKNNQ
ncbi:hypothetical protein K1X76_09195 [bacterium]|nr:hypothetical protein [bacterium]